ncbi:MAG: branched-chain amino acid transport system permease protein [Subtercola sp.]|nr:branched-chain amino acid transport system permease protein [Subtercola sp.]
MLQYIVNGLSLGAIYALFSLGLSVSWAGLNILNLAHGTVFMVGALTAWLIAENVPGLPFALALPLAMVVCGLIGAAMELLVFRQIRRRAKDENQRTLTTVIATVATSSLLIAIAQQFTGGQPQGLSQDLFVVSGYSVFGIRITNIQIVIIITAAVLSFAVAWFIKRGRQGQALRALSVDRDMAKMVGVSADRLSLLTMFGAGAMAGLAGVLLAVQINAIEAHMGEALLFKAFAIIIIAGVGSIGATVVAAVGLALIETFVAAYWVSDLRDVVVFGLIIVFLLVRPQGISSKGWQRA